MKVYFLLIPLALLALVGIGLSLWGMREGPTADGQAAVAYLKSEDGEWERQHGERTANRTTVPKGLPDGAEEEWLTKFVLTERSGERVGSQELLGTPYVAGFFFSTCPTICVQQNSKVKELQQRFRGEAIRFLSISCDPEVDRPEVLQEYAQRFDADPKQWWFLTGEMNYIRRVGGEVFRLGVVRRNHPEKFALMDAEGESVRPLYVVGRKPMGRFNQGY